MSFNNLKSVEGLSLFKNLESLVLDNNKLPMIGGGFDEYSKPVRIVNPKLKVLSVNNNRITNLDSFLRNISICFPNLTYLSLIRNPCCPDDLACRSVFYPSSWLGRDNYLTFREKCRTALPRLQFLDSTYLRKSDLIRTRSFEQQLVDNLIKFKNGLVEVFTDDGNDMPMSPLPRDIHRNPGEHHGTYIRNRMRYIGKQSEGNRFIGNGQL